LRPLRLGEEKEEEEEEEEEEERRRRNRLAKIQWPALLHRAARIK